MLKNINKYLIIFLYSVIPLSLIIGNASININIILIDLIFIYKCFKSRDFNFIKEKIFLFLIFIWFFLILNSILNISKSTESYDGFIRSLNFIRFILLVYATKYFFDKSYLIKEKIFNFWTIILTAVIFDIFFERIVGHNLIGIRSSSPERIASFFGKELIVGAFILGFGFIISAFLIIENKKTFFIKKIYSNLFLILIPFSIFISGERSNFIKSLIIFVSFLFIVDKKFLLIKKKTIFIGLIALVFFSLLIFKSTFNRQAIIFQQYKSLNETTDNKANIIKSSQYAQHYLLAWDIFKENIWLGVGTKNFRYICEDKKYRDKYPSGCTTHPHQIYFELLCEQGLIGFFIFLIFFITIFIRHYLILKDNKNLYHLMCFLFYIIFLIPILPSGSFFSTFNASIFWLNFSLMNYFDKTLRDNNNLY
jgi:O-antigen ligase